MYQSPSLQKYLKENKLTNYQMLNENIRPKTLAGFTTVLKKWLSQDDVVSEIELLRKYDLIQVNGKNQVA